MAAALALSYCAMISLAIAVNLIPVFLTTLNTAIGGPHGLTHEQLGRISAAIFGGLVSGILVTGPLADRFGPKPFAVLGNFTIGLGLGALGLAHEYLTVLGAVATMGFGAGALDMVLSPVVCAYQPDRRTAAMNWLHSFYCVGAVLTVLAGALTIKCGVGWRSFAIGLIVLPACVGVGFSFLSIPPLLQEGQERTLLPALFRRRFFLLALGAIFLGGATEIGIAQWLPAYAENGLHYSKWVGGMALLGFSLAMTIGRMVTGAVGSRVRPIPMMFMCCLSSAALFLAASFCPWRDFALGASILVGLTGSCLWPSTLGVTADRFPHGGASMFGILGAMGNAGGIFMPWLIGLVADVSTLRIGISLSAAPALLMAAALLLMRGDFVRPLEGEDCSTVISKCPA